MAASTRSGLPEHLRARTSALRRERVIQIAALALAAVCVAAAGVLLPPINQIRRDRQFVIDPESIKGLPPGLSFMSKLGTFRALAIDWASIRAGRLKDEGKTYEAMELHKIVCKLAPRFPMIWENAAWNMAYNISVMKYTPEERWQWVQNGISLLRDEGLVYNPKAIKLYKELSWIYLHKIGDFLDDQHLAYKKAVAVQMERVLGAPPIALSDEEYFNWFRRIVSAPRDLDKFIEEDQEVARLVSRLRSVGLDADRSLLDFVAVHLRPELKVADLGREPPAESPEVLRQHEVVTDGREAETLERLLAAIRSRVLRTEMRFDLDWMLSLMVDQFGPLDWRNAFAHGLYWASWGDHVTRGHEGSARVDVVNTVRFIFFPMQHMIMRGKIILSPDFKDPFNSYIELTPDTRYIPYLHAAYLRLGKEHFGDDPRFREGTPGPMYMNGFVSAMHNWIQLLYLEGGDENIRQAENYFVWLRENHPHPDGSTQEQYQTTVEEFVMGDIIDQLQTYKAANGVVRQFVYRAFKELALGREQTARADLARARQCYEVWMSDTKVDINDRRKMQEMPIIVRDELESFFKRNEIAPLYKARLWKELPLEQRQMVYDRLVPYFAKLCDAMKPPWDSAKAFGEPPGMEAFRQKEIEIRGKPRQEGVEQGEEAK